LFPSATYIIGTIDKIVILTHGKVYRVVTCGVYKLITGNMTDIEMYWQADGQHNFMTSVCPLKNLMYIEIKKKKKHP